MSLLELKDVHRIYACGLEKVPALRGLSLTLEAGSIMVFRSARVFRCVQMGFEVYSTSVSSESIPNTGTAKTSELLCTSE